MTSTIRAGATALAAAVLIIGRRVLAPVDRRGQDVAPVRGTLSA